jgi:hypothetical protein
VSKENADGGWKRGRELGVEMEKAARGLPGLEGTGQRARIFCKMCTIHEKLKNPREARKCREMAETLRADARPNLAPARFSEEEFDRLRPWMLW